MDKPWKVVFAFVAVFIAGAVFGGLFTLRASGRRLVELQPSKHVPVTAVKDPAPGASVAAQPKGDGKVQPVQPQAGKTQIMPALMRQLTQRLKLTPVQREKIKPIVGRASEDLQRLRQEFERERQANLADTVRVTDRMYSDVAALLSPDQRDEMETMRAQMQERAEKERKHRAELNAAADAALKAERAAAEGKAPTTTPPTVPAAKPPGGN